MNIQTKYKRGSVVIWLGIVIIAVGFLVTGFVLYTLFFTRGQDETFQEQSPVITEPADTSQQKKEGTAPIILDTTTECEFPDVLSTYTRQNITDMAAQVPVKPEGLISWILASYSNWNIVQIYAFETAKDTQAFYDTIVENAKKAGKTYTTCNIEGTAGVCSFTTSYPPEVTPELAEASTIWKGKNMVKTITIGEQKNTGESVTIIEEKVSEQLKIFVDQFKDCYITQLNS